MYPSERIDDKLNKDTSEVLGINPDIVDKVIRFQFRTANEACHTNTSVELTDLGVFKTSKVKVEKKLKTFNKRLEIKEFASTNYELTDRKRNAAALTSNSIRDIIKYLENKRTHNED